LFAGYRGENRNNAFKYYRFLSSFAPYHPIITSEEFAMDTVYQAVDDIYVLPSHEFAPGLGYLPMNAFLITCDEPVLVDTGFTPHHDDLFTQLRSLIDPKDLKWIFLTHEDQDHAGNLQALLQAAPCARLVTNFVGFAKLGGDAVVPLDRIYLANNGQSFMAGDRCLRLIRPPAFDSGATTGLFDAQTRTFFSVDAFGALIPQPTSDLASIPDADFRAGFNLFNSANHPWLHLVDPTRFNSELDTVRNLQPETLLSSHLPAAHGICEHLLSCLGEIPSLPTFVGPDQAALEVMLTQMKAV
jgi:flavorubredoxin